MVARLSRVSRRAYDSEVLKRSEQNVFASGAGAQTLPNKYLTKPASNRGTFRWPGSPGKCAANRAVDRRRQWFQRADPESAAVVQPDQERAETGRQQIVSPPRRERRCRNPGPLVPRRDRKTFPLRPAVSVPCPDRSPAGRRVRIVGRSCGVGLPEFRAPGRQSHLGWVFKVNDVNGSFR